MKTSVIEVHDMLSVLSVDGVEQRIGAVPGVESVTVNFAAASATVRYDETRLDIADIKSGVRQGGFAATATATDATAKSPGHEGHGAPNAPSPLPAPPAPAATTGGAGASPIQRDNAAPPKGPATVPVPAAQHDTVHQDKDKS